MDIDLSYGHHGVKNMQKLSPKGIALPICLNISFQSLVISWMTKAGDGLDTQKQSGGLYNYC